MVRKTTLFKRKLRGTVSLILFSVLLAIGVFGVCFGLWFVFKGHNTIKNPLAKSNQKSTYTIANKLQNLCVQAHLNCTAITINSDNTATITIDTDEQVFFSLQKDLSQQFASLQLTIAHLTIEGKRFSRLDFRFDNPVITY